jgi:hypothetical protein
MQIARGSGVPASLGCPPGNHDWLGGVLRLHGHHRQHNADEEQQNQQLLHDFSPFELI